MGAVSYTINDRIAAVNTKSVSLLQALLAKHNKLKINKKGDLIEYTDNTIQVFKIFRKKCIKYIYKGTYGKIR